MLATDVYLEVCVDEPCSDGAVYVWWWCCSSQAEKKGKFSTSVPWISAAKDVRRQTGTICYRAGSAPTGTKIKFSFGSLFLGSLGFHQGRMSLILVRAIKFKKIVVPTL